MVGPFPVLDEAETIALRERLEPIVPKTPFYTAHRDGDSPQLRRQIAEIIADALGDVLSPYLDSYRLFLGGGVFYKQPHPESLLDLHQDWTFVDETKYLSGSIWIPLVDTNRENGAFHAIVGSHRVERTYRGSPLWPLVSEGLSDDFVADYLAFFEVPAGQALAFDHRLIHGSFPNRSASPRPAIVVGLVPIDADLHHYYLAPDGRQFRYTVTEDFFHGYVFDGPPSGPHVLACEEISVPMYRLDHETASAEFRRPA